ncbi:unnamed protein product [Linum tenue]|uniref:Uncharacterized protein n=1 Tax=Linum tenue TaxID=586396 RepID=A0AAV0P1N0_9ROSI|nr:unnamed protein product [Linum tenue]
MMRYKEEKEAKKEAFRKYLESSGVVDTVTKGSLISSSFSFLVGGFLPSFHIHHLLFPQLLWVAGLAVALVALYEQDEKPSSALEFIQQKLGGPSLCEYEKLQAEMSDLQLKYNELLATHQVTVKELEEVKVSHTMAATNTTSAANTTASEIANGDVPKDDG